MNDNVVYFLRFVVGSIFAVLFVQITASICIRTYFVEKRKHLLGILRDGHYETQTKGD